MEGHKSILDQEKWNKKRHERYRDETKQKYKCALKLGMNTIQYEQIIHKLYFQSNCMFRAQAFK